jgi:hypothetical protein
MVPGTWTECRRCGTAIPFAQSPLPPARVAMPAPAPAAAAPASSFAGVDTMLPDIEPTIRLAPQAPPRANGRTIAIVAIATVCLIGAAFSLLSRGGHHAAAAPVILTPQAPFAGIPTSLSGVVRIEAESSRHTALSVVISAANPSGTPLTITQLTGLQPGYQWVEGNVASTTNTMISITSAAGIDTVAVSGTNHTICAYGRWLPGAGSTYVTMDNVKTCNATTAPTTGWSTLAGGTAQDLPDENGN